MSIIKVENLTFSYPSSYDDIFHDVGFQIDADWKLGFIGRNGRGKTTFLNLLRGKYEYKGSISSSVKFEYFPYAVPDLNRLTIDVLTAVCPAAQEWQFIRETSCLDVDCGCLYRPFSTLSEGERTKVLLAALFLNEERFLLIDEPTNHLDTKGRELLSDYLNKKKSFILVSHDRRFLDGCVDHIISFNKTDIEVQKGNFSSFMANFEREQEFQRQKNRSLQTDITRLKESAKRTADWADRVEATKYGTRNSGLKPDKGYIGHKSAKMMKRAKSAQSRREKEIEEKSKLLKNAETADSLKISPLAFRSERLASFSSVAPIYDGKAVCAPVSFEIKRGDRIALEGKNGSGKSSLLKILCARAIEHSGTVTVGSNLIISYVPQDTSFLRGTLSAFAALNEIDESLFKAVLHKMGFEKRQFEKDMSEFSDVQKKKTLIAKSLCERAHLYVWDEPLNYVDVFSRIQIENLLDELQPAMIFVEHDKAFQEKIANGVVKLL